MEKKEPEAANKATYSIEEICAAMKNRKGFEGGYEEAHPRYAEEHIRRYINEQSAAAQQ